MLCVIIVNYKNEKLTIDFVNEELIKITLPHKIVIINNEATELSTSHLKEALKAVVVYNINSNVLLEEKCFVLPVNENIGFARANNIGATFASINFSANFLLFSNNDIKFNDSNVVEKLINKISHLPDVAIIGPKIVGLDGRHQSPEPYVPFWKKYFGIYWLTPFISKRAKIKLFNLDYAQTAEEGFHYKLMGSFFISNTNDFFDCGMMDPNTFLYGEEVILSERLLLIGKKVFYYPAVSVTHLHGVTISKHISSKRQFFAKFKSESYYYIRYRSVNKNFIVIVEILLKLYWHIRSFFYRGNI